MPGRINRRFAIPPVASAYPLPVVHIDILSGSSRTWQPDRQSLVIAMRNGLPVGQVYCEAGGFDRNLFDAPQSECAPGSFESPAGDSVEPTISVVICTRDRPDELERCLASFSTQTRRPDEIIVVDNASRDGRTRKVSADAGVIYVREDREGLSHARNTGIAAATSDIVAFTDDDVVLHADWVAAMSRSFSTPDTLAVTGLVLPMTLDSEAQYIFETEWGFGRGFSQIEFGPEFYAATRRLGTPVWNIGAGASMAFRRSAFEQIGPFDIRLGAGASGCSEDSEYWYRILKAGGTCRYDPRIVAYHSHRDTLDGLGRQLRAYMKGHVAALLVQYEVTGDAGNVRYLWTVLTHHLLGKLVKRVRHGRKPENAFIAGEIAGAVAGLFFYAANRRSARARAAGGLRHAGTKVNVSGW